MDPGVTYVVRIYRRAGRLLAGIVEDVTTGVRTRFGNANELWKAVTRHERKKRPSKTELGDE